MKEDRKIYPKVGGPLYAVLLILFAVFIFLALVPALFIQADDSGKTHEIAWIIIGVGYIVCFLIVWLCSLKFNSHKDKKSLLASQLLGIGEIISFIVVILACLFSIFVGLDTGTEIFSTKEIGVIFLGVTVGLLVLDLLFTAIVYAIAVAKKKQTYIANKK